MKRILYIVFFIIFAFSELFSQEVKDTVNDSLSIDSITIGSTKEFESVHSREGHVFWD